MKKIVFIGVVIIFLGVIFCVANGCSKQEDLVNYDIYTVGISSDDMRGFGYGVVLKQENGKIYCLSAAHLFDKLFKEYYITFYSGKPRKVLNINRISGSDIAIVEVDGSGLLKNRDYSIPQFARYADKLKDAELHVFNDGYYRVPFRKMIAADDNAIYLPGKIEKGRSGSPLFIKNHPVCLGIVSGYYTAESKYGERVIVLMPEKEYCRELIDFNVEKKSSFWTSIGEVFRAFFRMIANWF